MRYKILIFTYLINFIFIQGCNKLRENQMINLEKSVLTDCKFLFERQNVAYLDGKIFEGICSQTSTDNKFKEFRKYKKGQKNGKQLSFFLPEETIHYIGYSMDNMIHGKFREYFRNGNLYQKGKMFRGTYDGIWKIYSENGDLKERYTYSKGTLLRNNTYDE